MYSIYEIIGPTGKSYVGYTRQPVPERFGQHIRRARRRKTPHPFYDSIKKHGEQAFSFHIITTSLSLEEAKERERGEIASRKPAYNISPGGEDGKSGIQRLAELRLDPSFDGAYRAALSKGCRNSKAHEKSWGRISGIGKKFREDNPREAYENTQRALRLARKKVIGKPSWNKGVVGVFHHTDETRHRLCEIQQEAAKKPLRRKRVSLGVKRSWDTASETSRRGRVSAVAGGMKDYHKNKTTEQADRDLAQLATARKNIDHEYRKKRQREALQAYWTPERRAEKAEFMKKECERRRLARAG